MHVLKATFLQLYYIEQIKQSNVLTAKLFTPEWLEEET